MNHKLLTVSNKLDFDLKIYYCITFENIETLIYALCVFFDAFDLNLRSYTRHKISITDEEIAQLPPCGRDPYPKGRSPQGFGFARG